MTPADLAALAAAGLTRYAEGRARDFQALRVLVEHVNGHLRMTPWRTSLPEPQGIDDAVARLKRELRR